MYQLTRFCFVYVAEIGGTPSELRTGDWRSCRTLYVVPPPASGDTRPTSEV